MEFPKRMYVVTEPNGLVSEESFEELPAHLLEDGAEVAIYGLLRVKKVKVTRKLVAANGEEEETAEAPQVEGFDRIRVDGKDLRSDPFDLREVGQ